MREGFIVVTMDFSLPYPLLSVNFFETEREAVSQITRHLHEVVEVGILDLKKIDGVYTNEVPAEWLGPELVHWWNFGDWNIYIMKT